MGDTVFGVSLFGAYASELVVKAAFIRRVPAALELTQAATFPVASSTAWYALSELARIGPGQRVLVHSAAGGVGSALCQLARAIGADALGVVGSAHKASTPRLKAPPRWSTRAAKTYGNARALRTHGFDAVFDANGADTLHKAISTYARWDGW
ncbi:MAG: hypothetical protein QM756_22150 [Polyangiaceae bacterium]